MKAKFRMTVKMTVAVVAAMVLLPGPAGVRLDLLAQEAGEPAARDEKLLFCGFERDELAKFFKVESEEGDKAYFILPGDRGRVCYIVKKGEASQGNWALAIDIGTNALTDKIDGFSSTGTWWMSSQQWRGRWRTPYEPGFLLNIQPASRFTEMIDSGNDVFEGTWGSTGHHARTLLYTVYAEGEVKYTPATFPRGDWTAYRYLRMDVKPEKGEVKMRMACEDDKVFPPIERRYIVPAGQWSTLEIDLAAAVKELNLDLSKMTNFWLFLEETSEPTVIYMDNIRLAKKDVATRYNVLKGGPKAPRPVAEMPKADTVKRETSKLTLEKPIEVPTRRLNQRGQECLALWAYDNNRMLLNIDRSCYYTNDGGKSWETLGKTKGKDKAYVAVPTGSTADFQGETYMAPNGNVVFFGNYGGCVYHCSPPVDNLYSRVLVLKDDGWVLSPFYIVGCGGRSCSAGRQIVCLPSGRIWASYRMADWRVPEKFRRDIHAMYSDDSGITWRGAGVKGKLTGTLADTYIGGPSLEGSGHRYPLCDPLAIVPYGDHVACLWNPTLPDWSKNWGLRWSYYDGESWSETGEVASSPRNRRLRAVGIPGKKEIFVSTDDGILHCEGTSWKQEPGPKGVFLTVAGNAGKEVLCAVGSQDGKLLMWQRRADGQWTSREVAEEAPKIEKMTIPQWSPENFVPVVWQDGDKVKLLRIPVEQ